MEKSKESLEKLKKVVSNASEYLNKSSDLASGYVPYAVCPVLEEALNTQSLQIEKWHKIESGEVIHYTSIAALISMIENVIKNNEKKNGKEEKDGEREDERFSSLRLYDSLHLNDPDEGKYLFRSRNFRNLLQKYDWLKEREKGIGHAYIASFIIPTEDKDMSNNLVFWRMYGKGGEGCSLSLKVSHSQLQELLSRKVLLRKVLYGEGEKLKKTVGILEPVFESLGPLVSTPTSDQELCKDIKEKLSNTVWKFLEKFRYLYKSEAYDYENECRFILAEPDKNKICFKYQERNNAHAHIRHYYEDEALQIKDLLISGSEITLGPCVPYSDNVRYCIETLLKRAELGAKVKISKIPYRKV